jgi:hypothetical protein
MDSNSIPIQSLTDIDIRLEGCIIGLGATTGTVAFPFAIGAIANRYGIIVLQPMYVFTVLFNGVLVILTGITMNSLVALIVLMMVTWCITPRSTLQTETKQEGAGPQRP